MPKRKKPSKALERCALEVKNSGEFVEHIANIAERYRREHALDRGGRSGDIRKSLRDFQKHATALAAWLRQARKSGSTTPEREALDKVGTAMRGVQSVAHAESASTLEWLTQAEQAASRCLADVKLLPRKPQANAPRIAAEALRATFEHHRLKWSAVLTKQRQSDAVRLLCAIAKSAGDVTMTPESARAVIRATR